MKSRRYNELQIDGAMIIDKPAGITSAEVLRKLKHRFHFAKIGHAGTLDPMATGVLIVLLGEATKLQAVLMAERKRYAGEIRLGISTDTDDITGAVLVEDKELAAIKDVDQTHLIARLIKEFSGKILQTPPRVSAIKVDGERSYELARRGESVELESREIEIYKLALEFVASDTLRYDVECSKGTYVRSLARDIGVALQVPATLASIRRMGSGGADVSRAVSLADLLETESIDGFVRPLATLAAGLPRFVIDNSETQRVRHGDQRALARAGESLGDAELAALFDSQNNFLGLIERFLGEGGSPGSQLTWRIRCLFSTTPPVEQNINLV